MALDTNTFQQVSDELAKMVHSERKAADELIELQERLAQIRLDRKGLAVKLMTILDASKQTLDETLLELDYAAGDRTIVRDASLRNGGGGYRRANERELGSGLGNGTIRSAN